MEEGYTMYKATTIKNLEINRFHAEGSIFNINGKKWQRGRYAMENGIQNNGIMYFSSKNNIALRFVF